MMDASIVCARHLDEQDVVDLMFAPLLGPALVRGVRGAVVQSRQPSATILFAVGAKR